MEMLFLKLVMMHIGIMAVHGVEKHKVAGIAITLTCPIPRFRFSIVVATGALVLMLACSLSTSRVAVLAGTTRFGPWSALNSNNNTSYYYLARQNDSLLRALALLNGEAIILKIIFMIAN